MHSCVATWPVLGAHTRPPPLCSPQVGHRDVAVLSITPLEAVHAADAWRPWSRQPIYAGDRGEDAGEGGETAGEGEAVRAALGRRGGGSTEAVPEFSVS